MTDLNLWNNRLEASSDGTGEDLREYRLTNNTEVLEAFQKALDSQSDRYVWASPVQIEGLDPSSTALPTTNPVLAGTEAMTDTITLEGGSEETVTWTATSYSSPFGDILASFDEDTQAATTASLSASGEDRNDAKDEDDDSAGSRIAALTSMVLLSTAFFCSISL